MKKLLLLLFLASPAFAQAPSISSISGVIGDGNSLTITGTGFGTKGVAAPMKFDKFEGGTLGATIGNGWTADAAANCTDSDPDQPPPYNGIPGPVNVVATPPVYSNTFAHSGTKSAKCRFDESTESPTCLGDGAHYSSSVAIQSVPSPGFTQIYMDGWIYYSPANPESRNVKIIRVHTGTSGQPNLYLNFYCHLNTDDFRVGEDGGGVTGYVYDRRDNCNQSPTHCTLPRRGETFWANGWHHVQLYLKQSGINTPDGQIKLWTDQVLEPNQTNWINRTSNTYWASAYFGNFVGHDGISPCTDASLGDTDIYWDDAYIDSTQARVLIGDASSLATCTHTEIQPATTWSSTSITITANRGTFPSLSGMWAFVVNRNGSTSPGKQLQTNVAPVLATPSSMTVNENATADQSISATDQDGDPLTFSKQSGPTYMTVTTTAAGTGTGTGNIHLAPGYTDAGSVLSTIRASDGTLTNDQTCLVTVNDVPRNPSLTQPSNQTMNEGAQTDVTLNATDADLNPLTFSMTSGPTFASVTTTSSGAGTATGNIHLAPNYADAGSYSVVSQVTDGSLTDSKTITVTVNNINRAPVMTMWNSGGFVTPIVGCYGCATTLKGVSCRDDDGDTITFTKLDEGTALFNTLLITKSSNTLSILHFAPQSPDDDARVHTYVTQGIQASDGTDHEDRVFNCYFGDPMIPF